MNTTPTESPRAAGADTEKSADGKGTSACCSTTEKATCCEPSAKSACCGTPDEAVAPATRCGCR